MSFKKLNFLFYRYKFIILYTFIGVFSLVIELIISKILAFTNASHIVRIILPFISGLVVAFILNVKYNFRISPSKRYRALFYFIIISTISFTFQLYIRNIITDYGVSMDISRFIISGCLFIFSYALHRKLTFKEFKKVGVAIYADGVEDIKLIYDKISNISDFIHIDIVDKSFNPNCKEVKAYRAEVVRAYWQNKSIEVHLMSRTPSIWLDDLIPFVDIIYIHPSIDENFSEIIDYINSRNVKAGIAISIYESIEVIDTYIQNSKVKNILLLTIPNPGFSGQVFEPSSMSIIEKLNQHKYRDSFQICVDGGVNDVNVKDLNVESVVSGSYVLSSSNPIKNIMHLQTSGEYA